MPFTEDQLLEKITKINTNIKDEMTQIKEYSSQPSMIDAAHAHSLFSKISTVDITSSLSILMNTKNIVEEFEKILNNEERRRKYVNTLSELKRKDYVKNTLKESRKRKMQENISPYILENKSEEQ